MKEQEILEAMTNCSPKELLELQERLKMLRDQKRVNQEEKTFMARQWLVGADYRL